MDALFALILIPLIGYGILWLFFAAMGVYGRHPVQETYKTWDKNMHSDEPPYQSHDGTNPAPW